MKVIVGVGGREKITINTLHKKYGIGCVSVHRVFRVSFEAI